MTAKNLPILARLDPNPTKVRFFTKKKKNKTVAREIAGDRGNVVLAAEQTSHGGLFSYGFRGGGREKDRERERRKRRNVAERERGEREADGEVIVPMKARTDLLPCPNGSADGTNHHP